MERLFGLMPQVLKELGAQGAADEAVVFAAWKQCAGELICERSRPLEYFEQRLIVAIQDATWRAHLEALSPRMLASLNAALGQGSVKFIEFRVDPTVFDRRSFSERSLVGNEVPVPAASIVKAAQVIEDVELRKSFLSASAAYLNRQRDEATRNSGSETRN
jgi:hypothetical protein